MVTTALQKAAQAVIDRWDSPSWKDQQHTAEYIAELRKALDAEIAQAVEPDAWLRHDGFKAMTDDEKASWIESGNSEVVEEYTKPLYLHPPQPQATTPVPEGYVLVPIEPTDAMCEAAWDGEGVDYVGEHKRIHRADLAYIRMLAAAQGEKP